MFRNESVLASVAAKTRRLSICLTVVAALAAVAPSQAWADGDRYGVVTIVNDTPDVDVTYRLRWGDGEWEKFTLQPGMERHHSWKYEYVDEHSSPTAQILFHNGIGEDRDWETMELKRTGSPEPRFGRKYSFVKMVRGGDHLGLLDKGN